MMMPLTHQHHAGKKSNNKSEKEEEVVVVVKTPPRRNTTAGGRVSFKDEEEEDMEDSVRSLPSIARTTEQNGSGVAFTHTQAKVENGASGNHLPVKQDENQSPKPATENGIDKRPKGLDLTADSGANERGGEPAGQQNGSSQNQRALKSNDKRSRVARTALVRDGKASSKRPRKRKDDKEGVKLLPSNQYETVLTRRAVRKGEASLTPVSLTNDKGKRKDSKVDSAEQIGAEPFGDVSLGMQLAPIGGKIIVQGLIPLKDGRASPAQLSGCIQRGDVLLQINHRSLVNIPFDQLMLSLTPLSSPLADGTFPRQITLRFAAGQGLELLKQRQEEEEQAAARQRHALATGAMRAQSTGDIPHVRRNSAPENVDGAADILGLFTMVDQLSGVPMFQDEYMYHTQQQQPITPASESDLRTLMETPEPSENQEVVEPELQSTAPDQMQQRAVPLEETISRLIANERISEREECDSEFFSWNDSLSLLLRRPDHLSLESESRAERGAEEAPNNKQTKADLLELGHEAFKGAKKLSAILEKIDRGWSDRRSFHSLSATLSLYSKASTRRRYVLDGKALPVNFEQLQEEEDDSESAVGGGGSSVAESNAEEELDGDELLLQLAAQDEIWRKQVIEFLEDVVEKLNNPKENNAQNPAPDNENENGTTSAISSELGSFLFGDRMTKALMLRKKPQALPPDEITALLFDLTTNVSATVPDQIRPVGSGGAVRSALVPFIAMKTPAADSNVMLAARFLLDEVLPVWLKTFRPLPWDQRRVLWPLEKTVSTESTAESTRSDDSMTVDSMTSRHSPSKRKQTKNLREQIEDQELNVETRAETCFLATFYFTQKLLPQLVQNRESPNSSRSSSRVNEAALQAAKTFVKDYGAYLRLHTCIAYSAVLRAQDIIKILLEVGRHDPRHRESIRRFSRSNALLFYEPAVLSAVLERLHGLGKENVPEQRLVTIQLCSSAYPDVRPWQVDRECRGLFRNNANKATQHQKVMNELYYRYLTYILHPSDGHEAARHDSALVMEWCELSVRGYLELQNTKNLSQANERKDNFFTVASKASSHHVNFTRDLSALLNLSMDVRDHDLSLDLVTEILEAKSGTKGKHLLLSTLRTIGRSAIASFGPNGKTTQRTLGRVVRLFERADEMRASNDDDLVVDVTAEIVGLLDHATKSLGRTELISLIDFFSKEAVPRELLLALANWSSTAPNLKSDLYPVLRTLLRRGADDNEDVAELSISLKRVRQARHDLHDTEFNQIDGPRETASSSSGKPELWKRLSRGLLPLAK